MKVHNMFWTLLIGLVACLNTSCDNYEVTTAEYDQDKQILPDDSTTLPEIPADWELELIADVGQQGKGVYLYKDLKYNKLFTRARGWNGGDGVLTVGLPNGDVFWTFNDSFYGVVEPETRARKSNSFPRNTIMVQKSREGKPGETEEDLVWLVDYVNWKNPQEERYFHSRTHIRHPEGERTEEEIATGEIDQGKVYWSGDGTVYNGKLQMIWFPVQSDKLLNLGTSLATYNLDGTIPENYYLPDIPDYLPKEGNYLFRESELHQINDNAVPYGSTLLEDEDGHTYLYGTNGFDVLVARTETHDLYSSWQYYVRSAITGKFEWQDKYPSKDEMLRSVIMGNGYQCNMPWVFKDGDTYYMVAQAPFFSTTVNIYRSDKPYGPFTDQKLLFNLPLTIDKIGNKRYFQLYMVNLHPALSRKGELVFSTNTNTEDFWDNFNFPGSADFYRPFFYRVFNWKNVYEEEKQ